MSREEIGALSETLLIAGSETTATLLCGVTFYLLTNPDSLQKLTDEIRNSFSSAADITLRSLTKLPYLQACLDEALRLYPPVPSTLPRLVRPEGDVVNGKFIPGGVSNFLYNRAFCFFFFFFFFFLSPSTCSEVAKKKRAGGLLYHM